MKRKKKTHKPSATALAERRERQRLYMAKRRAEQRAMASGAKHNTTKSSAADEVGSNLNPTAKRLLSTAENAIVALRRHLIAND